MNKKFNKLGVNEKGFTIIELIVVIAIIAVLASIVMVNVTQYIDKSQNAAVLADLKQVSTLATTYFDETGNFKSLFTNARLISIGAAVENINSSYTFTEQDENGVWSSPSTSVPNPTPSLAGKWIAYVTKGTVKIGCTDYTGYIGTYTGTSGLACVP